MNTTVIPIEYIDRFWDDVRPMLEPAVEVTSGRYTTYDVYTGLHQGRYQIWVSFGDDGKIVGCVVTEVIDYPSKRCLSMLFTAGRNISSWMVSMNEMLGRWAKERDCDLIEGHGRIGWSRLVGKLGCRPLACTFERDV
jgi:hypothetical protein